MSTAASSSSTKIDATLPMAAMLHMLTIKLSSTNYLLWRNQVLPLLSHQNLQGHVDGTISAPAKTIITDGNESPNPDYLIWLEADQRAVLLLQSSLTEEAMAEALGHTNAHQLWSALETAYSHDSMERTQNLRDALRQLRKDNLSVAEFGKKFKALCDQLAAIGQPVAETDKTHWFLCGLGATFESFSTAYRAIQPQPSLRELLSKVEGHELFLASIHGSPASQVAFSAMQQHSPTTRWSQSRGRGRSGRFVSGNFSAASGNRGRGRRPPNCQLCH